MYDNIGKKIKTLTKIVTIVLICGCFIGFIIAGASAGNGGEGAAIGILLGAASSLLIWVGSFFMYAFGELVDKVCDIEARIRNVECKREIQGKEDRGQKVERSATDINYYQLKEKNIRLAKIEKLRDQGLISEEEYREIISKEE